MIISVPTSSALVSTNVVDIDTPIADVLDTTLYAASGGLHSAIVKTDNTLWTTGKNTGGQLGLGDATNRNVFTQVTAVGTVKMVSCGSEFTAVVKTDGTLWMTGVNTYGQFGNNTNTSSTSFVNTGITDVAIVECGLTYTFIIKNDGTVWSTGRNDSGQLGLGHTTDVNSFTEVNILESKAISCGGTSSYIIKFDGTLWATGGNWVGQLGLNDLSHRYNFVQVDIDSVRDVSAGKDFAMLVKTDGTIWSTGSATDGRLGTGDSIDRKIFTKLSPLNVLTVSCGDGHTHITKTDGTLWATGDGGFGQLGIATNSVSSFTQVTVTNPKSALCGGSHTILIKTDGSIYGAGYNSLGTLGVGNNTVQYSTFTVATITGAKANGTYMYPVYTEGDTYTDGKARYSVTPLPTSPSMFATFSKISAFPYVEQPLDNKNYTYVTASGSMTYTIKSLQKFDTIALGRCKADSVTIVFKNSLSVTVNTVTKNIDSSRDELDNLEKWHTTVIYYATSTVEANGTAEITLVGSDIELGSILPGMSVDAGLTNLILQNSFIDYSVYKEDEWGNMDYVPRAKIAVYKGSVDILITNYDRTDRLLTSLGGNLVILNGSDAKNTAPDSQTIFSSTQKIGRLFDLSQQNSVKEGDIERMANYTFTLKEIV